jgi:DNA-directed RNA polymerase subunit H (RpoH/RPB5)
MSSSNRILRMYKSRNTILDILETYNGYDASDYKNFSINEIDAMSSNNQLDMLLKHKTNEKKVYVKYFLATKQIRPQSLDDIIEDLFLVDTILTKRDTLIIIIDDDPNETIINKLKYLYNKDGIFVVIHTIQRLQFNILQHKLVPEMRILSDSEFADIQKKYNLKSKSQLPEISRFDPQAMALNMRPSDVGHLRRESVTALDYNYYRVCI